MKKIYFEIYKDKILIDCDFTYHIEMTIEVYKSYGYDIRLLED